MKSLDFFNDETVSSRKCSCANKYHKQYFIGYKRYLLKKLVKIKNGNRRQEQLKKWKMDNSESEGRLKDTPSIKNKTVAFREKAEHIEC